MSVTKFNVHPQNLRRIAEELADILIGITLSTHAGSQTGRNVKKKFAAT
jgi:hypothetical protein